MPYLVKLKNYTGNHDLVFFRVEDTTMNQIGKLVLHDGAQPILTLKPEGCVRAKRTSKVTGDYFFEGATLNVNKVTFGEPEGLPEHFEDGTYYIVSFIALQAIKANRPEIAGRFLIIDGAVVDSAGRPCGATALSVG